jgi:hypothetical protein
MQSAWSSIWSCSSIVSAVSRFAALKTMPAAVVGFVYWKNQRPRAASGHPTAAQRSARAEGPDDESQPLLRARLVAERLDFYSRQVRDMGKAYGVGDEGS